MKNEVLFKLMEKYADWQISEIDYNEVCKDFQQLTQSSYILFNVFDKQTKNIKILGVYSSQNKISITLDMLLNITWENKYTQNIKQLSPLENHSLNSFDIYNFFPVSLVEVLVDVKQSGNIFILPIIAKNEIVGQFICINGSEHKIENISELVLFSKQLASLIVKLDEENIFKNELENLRLISFSKSEWNAVVDENFIIEHLSSIYQTNNAIEVIGKPVLNFVSPENQELYLKNIKKALLGEKISMEVKALDIYGNTLWYKNNFAPLNGIKNKVYISAVNISEEKKAQQKIQKYQHSLSKINTTARVAGTWEFDLRTMSSVPDSFTKKRIKDENISVQTESEIFNYLDEEGKKIVRQLIQKAIDTKDGFDLTLPIYLPSGEKLWLRSIVEVVCENNIPVKFKIISVDVTEQQNLIVEQEIIKTQLQKQFNAIKLISKIRQDFISSNDNYFVLNNMLIELLRISESEYGLIGEVYYKNDQPYIKVQSFLSLLWNEQQKSLYTSNKVSYEKVQSLNTSFFSKLDHNKISITNNLLNSNEDNSDLLANVSPINKVISIPINSNTNELLGVVMIANKKENYTQADIEYLLPLISSFASIIKAVKMDEDRKKTESNLKTERDRLEGIIEGTGAGTVEWNIQTNELFFNEKWAEMVGYTLEELGPMRVSKWVRMLHPEDRGPTIKKARAISKNTLNRMSGNFRIKHKEGYWVWMHGEGRTLKYTEDNKPLVMYGTHTNVTHEYEAKQFLLQTLDDLHETQKLSKIGRWELDIKNNILLWNQTVYDIFELDSFHVKPTYEGFLELVHPDDAESVNTSYLNSLKNKTPYEITHRLLTEDGRTKWVIEKCHTEYDNDDAIRSIGLIQDITEIKLAEESIKKQAENYKLISDVATDLIRITTDNAKLVIGNVLQKITTFFHDVERATIFIRNNTSNKIELVYFFYKDGFEGMDNEEALQPFEPIMKRLVRDGSLILNYDAGMPDNPEAQKIIFFKRKIKTVIGTPIYTEKGDINGFLSFSSMVKKRKWEQDEIVLLKLLSNNISDALIKIELENNLIVAKQNAEEASKVKSEFLANISHEIRTPLNAVIGYSQLLKEKVNDPKLKSYVDSISIGGESLLSLINNVLDLSKIEAGAITLEKNPTSIHKVLTDLKQVFGISCKQKNISCFFSFIPPQKDWVLIDELRLKQILYNLISNAIKFTNDNGSINVDIKYKPTNKKSNYDLIFKITDSGIGIPKNQQERIFEAFVQQDGQNNRRYGGTGLGLAITKKLVELMHGQLSLESFPGKGSCFSIIFPHVKVIKSKEIRIKNNSDVLLNIVFNQQTILLVEDIASNRDIVKEYLNPYGLKVIEVESGKEALNYLKKNKPDLILMDIMMPEMDGFETTTLIRKNKNLNKLPIIALTARPLTAKNIKSFADYLRKPISKKDLLESLMKFLSYNKINGEINKKTSSLNSKKVIEDIFKQYKKTERLMSIDDVKIFSENLKDKAQQLNNEKLKKMAFKLSDYCNDFEIEKMNKLMKQIPEMLNFN